MKSSRILIVDDEEMIRKTVEGVLDLQEDDYLLEFAVNGEDALLKLESFSPDLIILDLNMPVMDGVTFLNRIGMNQLTPYAVVVLTGNRSDDLINTCYDMGVHYFLRKPFNIYELVGIVKRSLDLKFLENSLEHQVDERTRELRKSQAELAKLNFELERRVEERTKQLQESNHALEKSLLQLREDEEAGKKVQFNLLPDNNKRIVDYSFSRFLQPSMYMSGDFVDYFPVNDRFVGFYIADVSGHGSASAFVTLMLKNIMNNFRERYHQLSDRTILVPALMLSQINSELMRQDLGKYIAMFYGVFDTRSNSLTFANGGHFPFPLLISSEGVEELEQQSTPVGMFDFIEYENVFKELPSKFSLLAVSDGVLELFEEVELDEQIEHLKQIAPEIITNSDSLYRYLDINPSDPLPDDVTALIVKSNIGVL